MYKALRGGVQDVAVKVLLCKDEEQLLAFEKVLPLATRHTAHEHAALMQECIEPVHICYDRGSSLLTQRLYRP